MTAHKKRELIKKIILFTVALIIAVVFLLPIVLTIANSFMEASEISANYGVIFAKGVNGAKQYIAETVNLKIIPDMVSFSQYYTVLFRSPDYLLKFWNSLILVVPIMVFQLVVAVFASYGFTRAKSKFVGVIFFAYIILMLMPYQVTLVPNFFVLNYLGLLQTNWAIWLPGIFSPFSVYLLTKYMKRIPNSIFEAARIDGAGEFRTFLHVALPISRGIITSSAILIFMDYWNMVEQPLFFLKEDQYPLSIYMSRINESEVGVAFAVATIYMIPSLFVFLYGEEALVEGIAFQGGVKG